MCAVAAVVLLLNSAVASPGGQSRQPFFPVGVVDDRQGLSDGAAGLSELATLRFNVVARRDSTADGAPGIRVHVVPSTGTGIPQELGPVTIVGVETVAVRSDSRASQVRRQAWVAIGRGARGVIFDGWTTLRQNPDALAAAAAFADVVTRNAALFAPLNPSTRPVQTDPSADLFARFLESADAMVLVAASLSDSAQRVTLTFSPETPEAIWQNMETGGAVNFVAGPEGPTYSRTFSAHEVVVLMIRKQYK